MKVNERKVIDRCIQDGTAIGYNRAHKHTDTPTRKDLIDAIRDAIDSEINEWIDFGEETA